MKKSSIRFQILIATLVPVLLIDLFFTTVLIERSISQAEQLLRNKGELMAQQIAGAAEFYLYYGNNDAIRRLLDQSLRNNEVVYLSVYDGRGQIVAEAIGDGYRPDQVDDYYYYRHDIRSQSLNLFDIFEPEAASGQSANTIGRVHLYLSKQSLRAQIRQSYFHGALLFVAMLLLATLVAWFISRRITRPVFTLLQHIREVEAGNLGQTIEEIEPNEIGDVQEGFNSMSQALLANRMQLDQKIKSATLELMNAITDLEYKNRELSHARDHAEYASQVKSQFLANMSHEIRTPINGIQGFVNLLEKTTLDNDQNRYIDIIKQSTRDLRAIVDEILDFSKIESGKVEITEKPFDLYELVESTRDSLFSNALEKGIDLHLIVYSDTPRQLVGDKLRLKQILINLLGNAIKFTDQGFVSLTVYIEDESSSQIMLRFVVEDSGIGISPEDQAQLFQAFTQIESDSNRRYTGTGLGLVISKNLAALMGGDILLESQEGAGSSFTLILPFKPFYSVEQQPRLRAEHNAMIYAFSERGLHELQTLYNRIGFLTETEQLDDDSDTAALRQQLEQNLPYLDLIVFDLRHRCFEPQQLMDASICKHCRCIIMHYDVSLVDSELLDQFEFIAVINTCNQLEQLLLPESGPDEEPTRNTLPLPARGSSGGKRILLVDDNAINLALGSELIRLWGHQCIEAENAEQALQAFAQQEFDIILLDIQMPGIDGIELMRMLRERAPKLQAPIVALTANVLPEQKQKLLDLGFDGYLGKPLDEHKLRRLLDQDRMPADIGSDPQDEDGLQGDERIIDHAGTLQLSANNENLAQDLYRLMRKEMPEHARALRRLIEEPAAADREQRFREIGAILHKLQGVTCYAALPRLRKLLRQWPEQRQSGDEAVIGFCRQVIIELEAISDELDTVGAA
jgi:two-component system sensor histidine kinase BarA